VIRLPVAAVNLSAGTITFVRAKENTPRVAVLWQSTIDSLRPILDGRSHRQFVFESYRKGPWSRGSFANAFRALADKAGLKDIDFAQIRDGAYTAAVNAPGVTEKEAKLLAGHKLAGESDRYALRNPLGVAQACAAIKRHYFPPPEPPQSAKTRVA
jgi:integrase